MLFSFKLDIKDRGKLIRVGGNTIKYVRDNFNCSEIHVHDNNILTIVNDNIQIINSVIFEIENIIGKKINNEILYLIRSICRLIFGINPF